MCSLNAFGFRCRWSGNCSFSEEDLLGLAQARAHEGPHGDAQDQGGGGLADMCVLYIYIYIYI